MYKVEQRIRMEGFINRYNDGEGDTGYYDRVVDTKLLNECNDEFETADYFINNIHKMEADFIVALHNMNEGEKYIHRLDHTYSDDRLKTCTRNVNIGFEVEIVITKM